MQRPLGGVLKHSDCTELIVDYVAGTLDSATAAAFERHIESCAACREEARLQRAVWLALDYCLRPITS
jgi:anti-sigma factor RsiW